MQSVSFGCLYSVEKTAFVCISHPVVFIHPSSALGYWLLFSSRVMSDSIMTPRTVAHQAPLSMGLPRQEYWSRLSFPSSGDLPNPGIKPTSALAGRFFTAEPVEKSLAIA